MDVCLRYHVDDRYTIIAVYRKADSLLVVHIDDFNVVRCIDVVIVQILGNHACILWADLMEVGIAMESWSGRGGPFYSLYFADCALEPLQRTAHMEGAVKQGTEISVLCRDVETACLAELAAMCPLPLPILKADGPGADSDLLTYRRNRTTEASWGEAESDWLLDADSFRRRLWEERRKRTKKR